jgi:hypothetical protein
MILDQQSMFSDSQAITTTAFSTNVIDSLSSAIVPGAPVTPISVFARVVAAFIGGTSMSIAVVSADDAALSQNLTYHFSTGVLPLASLTKGALALGTRLPPQKLRKYVGLQYSVVGTMSAGTIIAGIVEDLDSIMKTSDFAKGFTV